MAQQQAKQQQTTIQHQISQTNGRTAWHTIFIKMYIKIRNTMKHFIKEFQQVIVRCSLEFTSLSLSHTHTTHVASCNMPTDNTQQLIRKIFATKNNITISFTTIKMSKTQRVASIVSTGSKINLVWNMGQLLLVISDTETLIKVTL